MEGHHFFFVSVADSEGSTGRYNFIHRDLSHTDFTLTGKWMELSLTLVWLWGESGSEFGSGHPFRRSMEKQRDKAGGES